MRLNVALAQIYPKLGDVRANLTQHLDFIDQAAAQHADLVVFPELSLTGYQVQDLVPELALRGRPDEAAFAALLDASRHIDIVFGFVHEDARHRFYTADAYLARGEIVHIHHKLYLPTYSMFDEGRYFSLGDRVRAFDTRFGRVGMLICEDFWHASPPYLLWMDGADLLIFTSSSPSRGLDSNDRLSDLRWVELVNQAYASLFTSFVVHVNRVGFEDGKNFWGGSSIADPNGEFLTRGHYFDETLIVQSIDLNQTRRTRARLPLLRDERPELMQRELARILGKE